MDKEKRREDASERIVSYFWPLDNPEVFVSAWQEAVDWVESVIRDLESKEAPAVCLLKEPIIKTSEDTLKVVVNQPDSLEKGILRLKPDTGWEWDEWEGLFPVSWNEKTPREAVAEALELADKREAKEKG